MVEMLLLTTMKQSIPDLCSLVYFQFIFG